MDLIVDGVEEVVNVTAGDIEEATDSGSTALIENLCDVAKVKGRVVALLDIDRALAAYRPVAVSVEALEMWLNTRPVFQKRADEKGRYQPARGMPVKRCLPLLTSMAITIGG